MDAPKPRLLSALPALVVADVRASAGYYRDVLGFRLPDEYDGASEFAIVDLRPGQGVHLKRGVPSPSWRCRMGVYVNLAPDDLERLVSRLASNGANVASPLRDQPWGMRELAVADPDGHLVRFGSDGIGAARSGTPRVCPEIPVSDASAAAAFCRQQLGMGPLEAPPDSPYFQRSQRDDVALHWWAASPSPFAPHLLAPRNRARGGIWDIAIEVQGLDALAAELTGRGAELLRGPVATEYGMREMEIAGPDGCTIAFCE